jgi:hypothetical protein
MSLNRQILLGNNPEKQSRRFQKEPNYNPWEVKQKQDKLGYGDVKSDRIATVKEKFTGLSGRTNICNSETWSSNSCWFWR